MFARSAAPAESVAVTPYAWMLVLPNGDDDNPTDTTGAAGTVNVPRACQPVLTPLPLAADMNRVFNPLNAGLKSTWRNNLSPSSKGRLPTRVSTPANGIPH